MILDICFTNREPEQIQNVRTATIYPQNSELASELMILHYFQNSEVMKSLPLSNIASILITNG